MLNPDVWRSVNEAARPRAAASCSGALDDVTAAMWVQAYDAARLGGNWLQLTRYLAVDVALLSSGTRVSLGGRKAVLAHMRAALRDAQVHEYNTTDLKGRSAGAIGIITYQWQLDWTVGERRQQRCGQDILVLRAAPAGWQLLRQLSLRP